MKHRLNFGGDFTCYFLIVSIAANELLALFSAKVTHVWTAAEDFTGAGNLEPLHDNFSGLLFEFHLLFMDPHFREDDEYVIFLV